MRPNKLLGYFLSFFRDVGDTPMMCALVTKPEKHVYVHHYVCPNFEKMHVFVLFHSRMVTSQLSSLKHTCPSDIDKMFNSDFKCLCATTSQSQTRMAGQERLLTREGRPLRQIA
jgi:hypothetical protein